MDEPDPNHPEPSDEEIALAAYRLWLKEGCPHGRDREHWLRARKHLITKDPENVAETPRDPGHR